MKKNSVYRSLVVACFVLVAAGCATNEAVKKEESIAPTTKPAAQIKSAPVEVSPPPVQQAKQVAIKESSVDDSKITTSNMDKLNAALKKVYFDFDSYDLSPAARNSLQQNMEFMNKNSAALVRIEGNCDERGSAEYNLALGEKRAKSAMQYLVTLGVPEKRLSVISYGKERPAVQGNDESAWSKNRRDDFVIQK